MIREILQDLKDKAFYVSASNNKEELVKMEDVKSSLEALPIPDKLTVINNLERYLKLYNFSPKDIKDILFKAKRNCH